MSLGRSWAIGWRFLVVVGVIFVAGSRVKIVPVECRVSSAGCAAIEIVDIADQAGEVERLSSRALFFGPKNEEPPESLKLPEWDAMQYLEPAFVFP
ncbi:MAG: hypothetical protein LBG09_01930 [Puniceicoccales bacterium]|nr:hypothetical protein [Puniceicoccales bacterium]